MKKLLYIFMSAILSVTMLTSCGEESESQSQPSSSSEIETISKRDEIIYLSSLDEQDALTHLMVDHVVPIGNTVTMWTEGFDKENPPSDDEIIFYFQINEVDNDPQYFIDQYDYDEKNYCVYVPREDFDYFVQNKFGLPEGYCKDSEAYIKNKNRYKFYTTQGIGCVISSYITSYKLNEDTVDIYCKFFYPDQPMKNTYVITLDNYGGFISCHKYEENLVFTADKLTDILTLCLDESTTPENPDFNLVELATRFATEEEKDFAYYGLTLEYDDPSVKRISLDAFNQVKMQLFGTEFTEDDMFPFTFYPTEEVLEFPTEIGWGMETYYAENIKSSYSDDKSQIISSFEMFAPDSSQGDPDEISIGNYKAVFDVIDEFDMTYLRFNHFEKV